MAAMLHGIELQRPDIDAVVDHIAAAAGLAGMLANHSAGDGEGVVLAV